MSKTVGYCALIAFSLLVLVVSIADPQLLSNHNTFLLNFVNHELLAVLGVILAITLASAAQLHLTFNQIEERHHSRGGLSRTRGRVHNNAYWLIGLFAIAVALVVVKPLLDGPEWAQSLFNGAALLVLLSNILILISITQQTFWIGPHIDDDAPTNPQG